MKKFLVVALFVGFVASMAGASLVIPHEYVDPDPYVDPMTVSASASSTYSWGTHYSPAYTTDESGLASDDEDVPPNSILYHNNDDYMHWLSQGMDSSSYHASTQTGTWIAYDLGDTYILADAKVFNYNERNFVDDGMKDVYVEYSVDGSSWSMVGSGTMEFPVSPGLGSDWYEGFTVSLGNVSARYVVFTATSNWGGSDGCGLSEVRFHTGEIPEPATIALLGLGGLALLRRKK